MSKWTLLVALALGCSSSVAVRDKQSYQMELAQWHKWSLAQAALLKGFITRYCSCKGDAFESPHCRDAADYVLTVEARADWHYEMGLYLGGARAEHPAQDPPAVSPQWTLCQ